MSEQQTTPKETAAAATETPARDMDKVGVMGAAAWLMAQSPLHRHLFMADMEWLVIPPVALGQFRLWRNGNQPEGFASWAYVSDDVDQALAQGRGRLRPTDWKSGPHLWLMDLVAPFGGQAKAIEDLKATVLKDQPFKLMRPRDDGQGLVVSEG